MTTPFVQAWDPNERVYVVFEVASGREIERQVARYERMDEVEPLPRNVPVRQVSTDPLGDFR